MKTQVIQLDADDDIISVRDKMSWAKLSRILLVFPLDARVLYRQLDFHLLKRYSSKLGNRLAVVTKSKEICELCRGLDIPVFSSTASAQRDDWGSLPILQKFTRLEMRIFRQEIRKTFQHSSVSSHSSFGFRFLFFMIGFLAVVSILLVFLPSAKIQISPQVTTQHQILTIRARPGVENGEFPGIVPAFSVSSFARGSQISAASGIMTISSGYAEGSVRFENLTQATVNIPVGTIVRPNNSSLIRYATQVDAVLPAGIGESRDVLVRALVAGPQGNIPSGAITAVEGELGASLLVSNPLPLEGGVETEATIATVEDRTRLHQSLLEKLTDECKTAIVDSLSPEILFFSDLLTTTVSSETYFPGDGEPGEILSLTMELTCTGLYSNLDDIIGNVNKMLDTDLPEGFSPKGEPSIKQVGSNSIVDGTIELEMIAERHIGANVNTATISSLIIGLTPDAALSRLADLLIMASPPLITITPSWWHRLPIMPFRITFQTIDN
jgi:hypothetical protein